MPLRQPEARAGHDSLPGADPGSALMSLGSSDETER